MLTPTAVVAILNVSVETVRKMCVTARLAADWEIARRCQVSDKTVVSMRPLTANICSEERVYTTRHGTPAKMNTAAINAAYGLRRTNADKRRAVLTLLSNEKVCQDEAGRAWSDRAIARPC